MRTKFGNIIKLASFCGAWFLFAMLAVTCFAQHPSAQTKQPSILTITGEGLNLLQDRTGNLVTSLDVREVEFIQDLAVSMNLCWANAKSSRSQEDGRSSAFLNIKIDNESSLTLMAGLYLKKGNEWRENPDVQIIYDKLLKKLASITGISWSYAALNTKYPTQEEKEEMVKRTTSKGGK